MLKESKSIGWIRSGAIWTYTKPPTREERLQETIRTNRELHNQWLAKHPELKLCPECGSDNYETTLLGFFIKEDHYHDPNRRTCGDCGHHWKAKCPACEQEDPL